MHRALLLALLLAVVPSTGCLVTGAIDPAGGGRFMLKLRLVSVAHYEPLKAALQSPDVILKGASMTASKWATFEIECADVRKLSTAPALASADVELTDDADGTRTLKATLSNTSTERFSDEYATYLGGEFTLAIELPGDVTRSTAASTAGRRVSWKWPIADMSSRQRTVLSATFRRPAAS